LITLIILALFAWYMQTPGNPIKKALATSTTVAADSYGSLINPIKGPVSRISIQDAAGKTVAIDKSSGTWMIKTATQAAADQDQAEAAAGQIVYLRIVTALEQAPDPVGTGLNTPAYSVESVLADGSPYNFKIGKTTVTSSGYYVQAMDGKVFVINKSDLDSVLKIFTNPPFLKTPTPVTTPTPAILIPGTPVDTTPQTTTPTKAP